MRKKLIDFSLTLQDISEVKIFFGDYDGIQRYDRYKYPVSKKLIELQQAQKWFPKELSYAKDKASIATMDEGLKTIYQYNLGFQTIADSLANRFLDNVYSTLITSPEWENVIKWQANFELLHSESYSHTVREVYGDPEAFFKKVLAVPEIQERLQHEIKIFSDLDSRLESEDDILEQKFIILEATVAQYALENVRFMISFLYTFKINKMTENSILGTANSIGLILNDETIHTIIFMHIINILKKEKSEGFTECFEGEENKARFAKILDDTFKTVVASEKKWFKFLSSFSEVDGMTEKTVDEFLMYYSNYATKRIKEADVFDFDNKKTELIHFFEKERDLNSKKTMAQENDLKTYTIAALVDLDEEHELNYQDRLELKMKEMGL